MQYLFLDSEDSKSMHADNTAFDFVIELPQDLNLVGYWDCALTEISYSQPTTDLYIYCNIINYSYENDSYKPILRIVNGSDIFEKLYFIPITQQSIPRIHIYIRDKQGNTPSDSGQELRCTLALKHGK